MNVELRKSKREDALSKRRNVCLDDSFDGPLSPQQENNGQPAPLPSLEEIRHGIFSDQPGNQYIYTQVPYSSKGSNVMGEGITLGLSFPLSRELPPPPHPAPSEFS